MAVTEEMIVTIAEAEVTDEYLIELHTPESVKHRTVLTPDQAMALSDELAEVAMRAASMRREDTASASPHRHGFDIDGPVAS